MLASFSTHETSIADPANSSGDFVSFFIPTPTTYIGGSFFYPWTKFFAANASEADGYIGLPLLFLLVHIYRTSPAGSNLRLFLIAAAAAALASLGPYIHVAGYEISTGPWLLFSWLPVFKDMLPSRFMLYAWMAIALALSFWLAETTRPVKRYFVLLVTLAFCFPNNVYDAQWSNLKIPNIFTTDPAKLLPVGSNILILPFSGNEIGDQYASGMKFKMVAQGYIGSGISRPFVSWPLMMPLYNNEFSQVDPTEMASFLATYKTERVFIVSDELSHPQDAATLLQNAGWTKNGTEDGVDSYIPPKLPPTNLATKAEAYQNSAHLALLQRRERINVCVLRNIYEITKVDLQPFYSKFFTLPLQPDSIVCLKK